MEGLLEVPTGVRTLADLIAFNTAHADEELVQPFYTSQVTWVFSFMLNMSSRQLKHLRFPRFTQSEAREPDQTYFDAIAFDKDLGGARGIDAALKLHNLDALLLLSNSASGPAAIVGYPVITGMYGSLSSVVSSADSSFTAVPLGFLGTNTTLTAAQPVRETGPNLPFGIAFMGTAFSEFKLISYAFAYEQATHNRLKQLAMPSAIPMTQLADIVGK